MNLMGGVEMHEILQPEGWAKPVGYANGVAARGRLVFVGGQVGWNGQCSSGRPTISPARCRQTLENVVAVLAEARRAARAHHHDDLVFHATRPNIWPISRASARPIAR